MWHESYFYWDLGRSALKEYLDHCGSIMLQKCDVGVSSDGQLLVAGIRVGNQGLCRGQL